MRRHRLPLVTLLLVSACAADDGRATGDASADEDGSAVIVTTTLAPTSTATAPEVAPTDVVATPDTGSAPATAAPASTAAPPTTAPQASTAPPTTVPPEPIVGDPTVATVVVTEVARPVDLAVRPGDDALYLVEQGGRVIRFADAENTVVADLTDRTRARGERGLLGLAFAPDGALAYLNYTDGNGDTVVAEYPVGATGNFDVANERRLLVVDQPHSNHNGGDLAIGPDGMLYVPLGDGGSANDPERRASDPGSLLGSLLRVDPAPAGDLPYGIPPDNPFAGGDHEGIVGAPEVWAWGLRNPWRITFDPVTDDLWIADVGQNEFEEVNRVVAADDQTAGRAANFGWSAFEGTERFNRDVDDPGDTVTPVLTYRHGRDGCSVSGGVPYRGKVIPDLAPAFVYSDYCSGIVWALDLAGGRNLTLFDGFSEVTAVRAGPDGEIYVLEGTGAVHRIVPG